MKLRLSVTIAAIVCMGGQSCSDSTTFPENNVDEDRIRYLSITHQPKDLTIRTGENAQFTADGEGQPPLSRRWFKNMGNGFEYIEGADSNTLTLTNVTEEWNGYQFRMEVTNNEFGTLRTLPATLTVLPAVVATITDQPKNLTICAGVTAQFEVRYTLHTSPGHLSFQWLVKKGTSWEQISGATEDKLTVTAMSFDDGNQYRVVLIDHFGLVARSDPATLSVLNAPVITVHPASVTANANASVTFSSQAIGPEPLEVQWQVSVDGGITYGGFEGKTQNTLTINAQSIFNGALFRAVYTNYCSSVHTDSAILTIL